jgi:hypothetical protein
MSGDAEAIGRVLGRRVLALGAPPPGRHRAGALAVRLGLMRAEITALIRDGEG